MNQLQIFSNEEFGSVRTLLIGNEPYFVGKDVADILGYTNSRDAIAKHVDPEDRGSVAIHDGTGGNPNQTVISESGLYSLILSSKLPGAKRFKRWITAEVLPAIRKHGLYIPDEVLHNPDLLLSALESLKQERRMAGELQKTVEEQRKLLTAMEPKADYFDRVLSSPEAMPVSIIAKDYGWSAQRMNSFLHACGIQYRVGRSWLLYADYADRGLTKSETAVFTRQNGETKTTVFTKWTQKGRLLIHELMKAAGYEPVSAQEEEDLGIAG